ncbi:MAG TPA: hypothetical protein VFL47_16165, partial [Flavisolibacter sp.]|nr:hypothetical protein [Flavisolibacter sp.]
MRKFLIFLGLLCFSHFVVLLAQDRHRIDSLKTVLATQREDTNKVKTYAELGWAYQWSSPDTAISYGQTGVALAKKLRYDRGLFTLLVSLSEALAMKGNYSTALAYRYQLPDIAQKLNDKELLAQAYALIGTVFFYAKDYQRALHYCLRAKEIGVAPFGKAEILLGFIGEAYFHLNQLDSAYVYLKKAYELDVKSSNYHWAIPYYYLAAIDVKKGHPAKAIDLYRKSIQLEIEKLSLLKGYNGIAEAFRQNGQMDSALIYARQSVQMGMAASVLDPVVDATALLVNIYGAKGETDSVLKYQSLMLAAKDSLYSSDKVRQLENVAFNESLRQQEIIAEQKQYKNRLLLYGLAVILIAAVIVGAVLYRSNWQKKKANTLLEQQKQEIEKQKREAEIEAALEKVRSRSISMQESHELKEVIQLVNQQLLQLNIFVQHAGFVIDYKETDDMHVWLADPFAMPYQVVVPYFDSAIWKSYNEAKKNGNNFFALQLSFEEKNKFYRDMFALIPGIPDDAKKYYAECPGLAISMVLLDNIALYIENFSGSPYTNEENATLMRFGKVFQQT